MNRAQEAGRAPAGRAAFGWYGSKARLAPKVAALASGIPHKVYVEAYAGSAAVLFAKPRAQVEIINDLDGQVVNFFRVLRDRPAALARSCQLTPYSRDEYGADATGHDGLSDLEQARRFWARCCQSFNSAGAGRRAGWAISSAPGSNEARSAAGLAAQLEAIAARMSGVYVEHADALDLIARHEGPDVLIYADPPYLAETRTGRARSRQGDYRHECDDSHHRALARQLRGTAASVLVSGYDHHLYRELYAGWHRIDIRVTKPSGNHSATAARHTTEVIWSNRSPVGKDTLFPLILPASCDETGPGLGQQSRRVTKHPNRKPAGPARYAGSPSPQHLPAGHGHTAPGPARPGPTALARKKADPMPRLMAVSLTEPQVRARTKTVTRRAGWRMLRAGDQLTLCRKVMGRRRGEPLDRIVTVEVTSVRREALDAITAADVAAEGFPQMTPAQFVSFFCRAHHGLGPGAEVTRIEWRYPD